MIGEGRGAFHLVEVEVGLLVVEAFVIIGHLLCGLRWWVW